MSTKYHLITAFDARVAFAGPGRFFSTVGCEDCVCCTERVEQNTAQTSQHIIRFFGNAERFLLVADTKNCPRSGQRVDNNLVRSEQLQAERRGERFGSEMRNSFQGKGRTFGVARHFLTPDWKRWDWKYYRQASTAQQILPDQCDELFLTLFPRNLEIRLLNASGSLASYPNVWHLGSVQNNCDIVVACNALWERVGRGLHCQSQWDRGHTHTLFTYMSQELHCSIPVVACTPKASQPTREKRKLTIFDAPG